MISVGIAGGIGSGKSMVSNILEAMGYPVYNADLEARTIVDTNNEVIEQIKSLFGIGIYIEGKLDRAKVSMLVFNDKNLLQSLNSIVHPAVAHHFNAWKQTNANVKIAFKEAAILFESGAYKQVDMVVAVVAPQKLRIDRVCQRDGVTPEHVIQRMANQLSDEELVAKSNFVLVNDGIRLLLPQVTELVSKILKGIN
ncbi:MAG: dephospho-CoA kinase [Bacteroidales bacterium]|nr:dephospho-CoA kinase [Bacteroidales bacterium]MDD4384479.1 dephospho-CoA kinase [Bacteroidales bacterium]MDY0196832.1 dephospho-CoA kinase [Tenuifilaceae bacterium]